jgi:hypothetical protein
MANAFRILNNLLRAVPPEAGGRAAEPLTDELKARLSQLAANKLSPTERSALAGEISRNELALAFLAKELGTTTPSNEE